MNGEYGVCSDKSNQTHRYSISVYCFYTHSSFNSETALSLHIDTNFTFLSFAFADFLPNEE